MFIGETGFVILATYGRRLGDVVEIEAQNFNFALKFN